MDLEPDSHLPSLVISCSLNFRSVDQLRQIQERLEKRLENRVKINFDAGLTYDQKLTSLTNFLDGKHESVIKSLAQLQGLAMTVGTVQKLNENGSIEIPWNWFVTTDADQSQ